MFPAPHLQPPPYHAPAVTRDASADADTLIPTHQMHACHRLAPARPAIGHSHALSSRPMPLVACKAGTDMDIELARCKKFSVRPTYFSLPRAAMLRHATANGRNAGQEDAPRRTSTLS